MWKYSSVTEGSIRLSYITYGTEVNLPIMDHSINLKGIMDSSNTLHPMAEENSMDLP